MGDKSGLITAYTDNTNKLLEDNRALKEQYRELTKSLEFHVAEIEKLQKEKKALKKEVWSLKNALDETREEVDDMYDDLATAINQIDDLEQYTRKHNLEIHGIAKKRDENIADTSSS
ncbi:hypothetical protein OS493_022825 [Desmophyllum pertusum]|uniref:Uncharacterized protein n=1 Tax=Desmophyllum pertusum TaxID=174260 RepID=A0A9W9ZZI7_9CNID|nr:hypothetical protein OS493_022825 [Desmophyllum pertusum]